MNKKELIDKIAKDAGLSAKDAAAALASATAAIIAAVKKGDSVQLVGFGTFEQRKRKARTARNPRTGENIKVPAVKVPKFKAGKAFKDAVK
jgi:DNA-binding protein HU-beta